MTTSSAAQPTVRRATVRNVTLPGATAGPLSATMELPGGPPHGYALMAHCFTCTSESHATARISAALADSGYAVVRFDFTGLGHSAGDFAETTFTTNVADLVSAAEWMRQNVGAVGLLVGHSLGGAAVIAAARSIPSVRAVVTIGAPAHPDHVRHLFTDLDDSTSPGRLQVNIGGRPFALERQFLDDIADQPQLNRVSSLGIPLLVLHSPTDQVVGIDNARRIYEAARHPKSFVALDGADHLLSNRDDAVFAAEVIAAWSRRYLDDEPAEAIAAPTPITSTTEGVVISEQSARDYTHLARSRQHAWLVDEPASVGGMDAGPNPYEVLLSALGACTSMTMRMYARRKGWHYGTTRVTVTHSRTHAKDCQECTTTHTGIVDRIDRVIELDPNLDEEKRQALLSIADRCPVHRTLTGTVEIITHSR